MARIVVALGIVALLAPLAAQANAGVGLLVLAVPVTILGLLPAIAVEAPVLGRALQLHWKRALAISATANVASTILGTLIAVATSFIPLMYGEFMRETVLISLVPMFFVTWWLESLVVRRMLPPEKKGLSTRATAAANAITYAGMAICVAIMVAPSSAIFNRWRLSPALNELGVARDEVSEYFAAYNAFPAPKRFTPKDSSVKSLVLEPTGRLVATLSFPGREAGDGKRIVYQPVITAGRITAWNCSSDVAAKYLPASCR